MTDGQVYDVTHATALHEGQTAGVGIGDKACDSNAFREQSIDNASRGRYFLKTEPQDIHPAWQNFLQIP
ncbi:hypothetical protein [Acetobacter orleanensis]|uniref:Uncharacterized protein n=1 Tax=Acetobacter orleanensis TaxID=104099 RepID=A0A4Y3TR02_9PROT|nr:hypothetical protein [Acetobacter orleanensis]GBR29405.1 hypothetical protein AA0473_2006 [Acetobacter orleanensis NRIC 0473]GEB84194.1 hypothetical protein AOR01nite_26710 [Acetobacter orleanensis]